MPQYRYAKMKNVYFIPSVNALILWLENESLIDFLDPNDHRKTIEGYPAPKRAVILANK
ncbi:uncharacterized protein DUF1698 [Avibacterium gallinarum]|uniref:Uncharacterized protein DUF1698 n=1 Tax=Avibacterium gallinarum TaxID=755 RepID=A0A379AVB1_AVIGA|nr:uncharacterized protein DUF1698 [Avibacterium gallinarum]SUB25984.1 tRNA (mo5U34)-methyltransferase [Avibacterium gallinarum]